MNTTQRTSESSTSFTLAALEPPIEIEVTAIYISSDQLLVWLRSRLWRNKIVTPYAKTLLNFTTFRRFVQEELGLVITHPSQSARSPEIRNRQWNEALETVFEGTTNEHS